MKNALPWIILLASLAACHKNDPALRNIVSVSSIDNITVPFGTEFTTIQFPTTAMVTYSDNSTENLNVAFTQGTYNSTTPGSYVLEGVLTPLTGTTNTQDLKATVTVVVAKVNLKTVSQDGVVIFEYFYDDQNRLDHYNENASKTQYFYTYSADNKVTQRLRKLAGNDYPEKYFYHTDGMLDRIEFYYGNNILGQTHTYTYQSGRVSRYDNSDQSINGLKFRTFEYDAQNNISKVTFDSGAPWTYVYLNNKYLATPLLLDLADPQNQVIHPAIEFTYTILSSYTAAFTYNSANFPTQEVRTVPGDGNSQTTFTYTYE